MQANLSILMIHQHYFPEMAGTARRTRELAESFATRGHNVSVITSFPREFRSIPGTDCQPFEKLNGVDVYRVKTLFEVKKNVILRMVSYFSFVLISLKLALKKSKNSNIVISIAPLSSGIIGSLIRIINKKHHHFDVPDILPDLGISAGMIKSKPLIALLYKIEKWVYNHSNTISAITHGQIKNINLKGVSRDKLSYIPDWIDDTFFQKNLVLHQDMVNQTTKYSGKKLISFVGNIGALQNPETFLETMVALAKEKRDEFLFLFIGDGIMLPYLKKRSKELNIKNIEFVGRVKRELIPAYMNRSDILVANYLSNDYMDICIPGKLFEYAVSKKPIVMGARGEAKNLIEKYGLGLAVAPSDALGFKEAIMKISKGSYEYNPLSEKFVEDFSLQKVTRLYDYVFKKVI